MPKVSIIVPNYNHEKYLPQRLESIFNQTFRDFEVILLDDFSTDNSLAILKQYATHPKVSQFIVNEQNSGNTFKQWSTGIELAQGEYIWIAESDDWADERFLESIVPELENDPELGIGYCQSYIVDENSQLIRDNLLWTNDLDPGRWLQNYRNDGISEIEHYLSKKNTIPNASAVVFRKNLISAKSIPNNLKMTGDWFIWVLILTKSNIFYSSECLNYFRNTSVSTRVHNTTHKKIVRLREGIMVLDLIKKSLNKSSDSINELLENQVSDFINTVGLREIFFSFFFWSYCFPIQPRKSVIRLFRLFKNKLNQ